MSDIALLLISSAITAFGLLASWAAYRRGGAAPALRGVAWSLVPMAAYLTGLTEWLTGIVFNPVKWAGVVLGGLAVLLYVTSGVMLSRRPSRTERKAAGDGRPRRAPAGDTGQGRPAVGGGAPARDDDLAEIEEILRKRGIS